MECKPKDSCYCYCGYTCGGPGVCKEWEGDVDRMCKCINEHFKRDCGHDFTGPMVKFSNGASVTCKHCGMTAIDHDCMVGP